VVLDNFCNSKPSVVTRLANLCGGSLPLVEADVRDTAAVAQALNEYRIEVVVHFAALKAVGEQFLQALGKSHPSWRVADEV